MRLTQIVLTLLTGWAVIVAGDFFNVTDASTAWAAQAGPNKARVNLVICGQQGAPITSFQTWGRELGQAGISNVRIRSAISSDTVGIIKRGGKQWPVLDVTGIIDSQGDLILPGGRFSPGDAPKVAKWIDQIAAPPETQKGRGQKSAFDLSEKNFVRMTADLEQIVNFSTFGQERAAVIDKIAARLSVPLRFEPGIKAKIGREKMTDELVGFSCGAVLAYVLRLDGLCFVPRESLGRALSYRVMAPTNSDPALWTVAVTKFGQGSEKMKAWPVGWLPEEQWQKLQPNLYEFHNVNVQNAPLDKVLESVGKNLDLPILIDRVALTQYKIDLAKIPILFPNSRTTYGIFLKRVLNKFKMRYELRVDEAGRPFIWVTCLMRLSGHKQTPTK